MRRNNLLVFDDYVEGTTVVYSPAGLNEKLGKFDQVAVMAVVDNVATTDAMHHVAAFDIYMMHSADARLWIYRNTNTLAPGTAEFHWSTDVLTVSTVGLLAYLDDNSAGVKGPLLGNVRFQMAFAAATTSAHVRLYVTQRDQGA